MRRRLSRVSVLIEERPFSDLTLSNESVQVLVVWSLNPEVASADVVDGFVVNHETAVRVLEGSVCGKDRVVWLDDGGSDLRSWVDTKFQLALLSVVD